jgi:hypothetical protein
MNETPFEAQRRKLRELREKQGAGEAAVPEQHISSKAQARRDAEAATSKSKQKRVSAQKKVKKTSASTTV